MQISTLYKTAYHYLLYAAIVMVVASLFTHKMNDFHWHDTYIVISDKIVFLFCSVVLILIWGIYYLLRSVLLAEWLTRLHVVSIIVLAIALFTADSWYNQLLSKRKVRFYNDFEEDNKRLAIVLLPAFILFLVGQLAFFINTIGGCIKYIVKKNR